MDILRKSKAAGPGSDQLVPAFDDCLVEPAPLLIPLTV